MVRRESAGPCSPARAWAREIFFIIPPERLPMGRERSVIPSSCRTDRIRASVPPGIPSASISSVAALKAASSSPAVVFADGLGGLFVLPYYIQKRIVLPEDVVCHGLLGAVKRDLGLVGNPGCTVNHEFPGGGLKVSRQYPEQGGLAAAVYADECGLFSRINPRRKDRRRGVCPPCSYRCCLLRGYS